MEKVNVCINSQTPLLQFLSPPDGSAVPTWGTTVNLDDLHEGVDYRFSPGGVTRMVYPLVRRLLAQGILDQTHWVSLNPVGPRTVRADGLTLHNVALGPQRMGGYGKTKEAIWSTVHGLGVRESVDDLFWSEEFVEYAFYNRTTSERIRRLDAQADFDLFYIHDFQQMPVGQMLDSLKPKIFRWHIPFDAARIPDNWRARFVEYLDSYDVVVVSCERYRAGLKRLGYRGKSLRLYPYLDPREYRRPAKREVATTCARWGVRPNERRRAGGRPDGPGESARPGNPGGRSPRSEVPAPASRAHRERELLRRHGRPRALQGRPVAGPPRGGGRATRGPGARDLPGHVPQDALDCFYERSLFTLLPSVNEGFGLVVVESWLHRRPALVTERAGIAELIEDGRNAILFDPDDIPTLARKMRRLLDDRGELAGRLARNATVTARECSIDLAARAEAKLMAEVLEA